MAAPAEGGKQFVRRDALLDIQRQSQALWAESKPFDRDPPKDGTKDKFMCTFPYPYMNGRLHLGHAFSLTKTEFAVRYQNLKGKNALWPFALHCTGMPIQAAAQRIDEDAAHRRGAGRAAAVRDVTSSSDRDNGVATSGRK